MKTITFDETLWQVVPKHPVNEMTGRVEEICNIGMGLSHPIYKAMLAVAPSPPEVEVEPVAWKALSDVQWMNIVNHDFAFANQSKEEAVHMAVAMVEAKLKELNHPPTEEIEALKLDAERLNFLGQTGGKHIQSCGVRWYSRSDYGEPHTRHITVRQAIDAAMKETK